MGNIKKVFNPFRRKPNAHSETTIPYDKVTEDALKALREMGPAIERKAHNDGANGIPKASQRTLCESELEIKATCEKKLRDSMVSISQLISNHETRIHSLINEMDLQGQDGQNSLSPFAQELRMLEDDTVRKEKYHAQRLNDLKAELVKNKSELEITENKINFIPRKRPLWLRIGYWSVLLATPAVDFLVMYNNTQAAGEGSAYTNIAVSICTGAALGFSAHLLGGAIKRQNKSGVIIAAIASIIFLALVGSLAFVYGSAITVGVNLVFLGFLTMLSYVYARKEDELIEKYFEDAKAIKVNQKEIFHCEKEKGDIRAKAEAKKLELVKKYNEEMAVQLGNLQESLAALKEYKNSTKGRFMAVYRELIHRYRNNNQKMRLINGFEPVSFWDSPDSIPSLRISDDGHEMELSVIPNGPDKSGPKNLGTNIPAILLFMVLSLGSCDVLVPTNGKSTDTRALVDLTDPNGFQPISATTFILHTFDLDTINIVFDAPMFFEVRQLNNLYSNQRFNARLPDRESWLFEVTKNRMEVQKQYYRDVQNAFLACWQPSGEINQSRLYSPMCETLKELSESKAEQKMFLLFSDGLEHNNEISFYKYKDNPKRLLQEKEQIIQDLEKLDTLPDLTGITIYIVCQSEPEWDELVYYAKSFWKFYLESKGATVHLRVSI
jgi:hypothetical protein